MNDLNDNMLQPLRPDVPTSQHEASITMFPFDAWVLIGEAWVKFSLTFRHDQPIEGVAAGIQFYEELLYTGRVRFDNPHRPAPQSTVPTGPQPSTVTLAPQAANPVSYGGQVRYIHPEGYAWLPPEQAEIKGIVQGLQMARANNEKTKHQKVRYVAGVSAKLAFGKVNITFHNIDGGDIFTFKDNTKPNEDPNDFTNPLADQYKWTAGLRDLVLDMARNSPDEIIRFNGYIAYSTKEGKNKNGDPVQYTNFCGFVGDPVTEWQVSHG